MDFPCRSEWDSVFDGYELEIHVVDHCNLNCAGCNHFTPLAKPFFIEVKDFEAQLMLIKEKLPTLKKLILLGGEPCLHPNLYNLCELSRQIFPDIQISVLTNGLELDNVVKNKYKYKDLNIHFSISKYPNQNYNENNIKEIENVGIGQVFVSRPFFLQTKVDLTGSKDPEKTFMFDCHVKKPCFTLKDYKIYICPISAHFNNFLNCCPENFSNPVLESDYLNLYDVTLEKLQQFCYQPKNVCRYCDNHGEFHFWKQASNPKDEYTLTFNEMYWNNYSLYLEYLNKNKEIYFEDIFDLRDKVFAFNFAKQQRIRFQGKMDIIIPYYNVKHDYIVELCNSIKTQSIIKDCMIYLIDDCSSRENAEFVIDTFRNADLNCIFLRNLENKGPGYSRNLGIENSYNKYIYFIDADDYFLDYRVLERSYFQIENNNMNYLYIRKRDPYDEENSTIKDFLVKRDFIEKNNIKYGEFYRNEDSYFNELLKFYSNNNIDNSYTNFIGSYYRRNSENNTSNRLNRKEKLFSHILERYCFFNRIASEKTDYTSDWVKKIFLTQLDVEKYFIDYLNDDYQKEYLKEGILFNFYLLSFIYYHYDFIKDFVNNNLLQFSQSQLYWLNLIKENNYFFKTNSGEVIDFKSLQTHVSRYLDELITEKHLIKLVTITKNNFIKGAI